PALALQMRKRIVSKDLRGLFSNKGALNPFHTGPVAVGLLSHKLLRWMVPLFLLGLFVSNLFLLRESAYRISMVAQVFFYSIAAAGSAMGTKKRGLLWSAPSAFCVMNLGAMMGVLHCVTGHTIGQWRTVR